jgi:hypothetical protein
LSHLLLHKSNKRNSTNLLNFMNDNKVTWQILMTSSGK